MPIRGFDHYKTINSAFTNCPITLLKNDRLIIDGAWFIKKYLLDNIQSELVNGHPCCSPKFTNKDYYINLSSENKSIDDCKVCCGERECHFTDILICFIETVIIPLNIDVLWIWPGINVIPNVNTVTNSSSSPHFNYKMNDEEKNVLNLFNHLNNNESFRVDKILRKTVDNEYIMNSCNLILDKYRLLISLGRIDGGCCINVIRAPYLAIAQIYAISQIMQCYVFTSTDFFLFQNADKAITDIVFFNQKFLKSFTALQSGNLNVVISNGKINITKKTTKNEIEKNKNANKNEVVPNNKYDMLSQNNNENRSYYTVKEIANIENRYLEIVHRPQILRYMKMTPHSFQTFSLFLGSELCPTIPTARANFNIEKIVNEARETAILHYNKSLDFRRHPFSNSSDIHSLLESSDTQSIETLKSFLNQRDKSYADILLNAKVVVNKCPVIHNGKVMFLSDVIKEIKWEENPNYIEDTKNTNNIECDQQMIESIFGKKLSKDLYKKIFDNEIGFDELNTDNCMVKCEEKKIFSDSEINEIDKIVEKIPKTNEYAKKESIELKNIAKDAENEKGSIAEAFEKGMKISESKNKNTEKEYDRSFVNSNEYKELEDIIKKKVKERVRSFLNISFKEVSGLSFQTQATLAYLYSQHEKLEGNGKECKFIDFVSLLSETKPFKMKKYNNAEVIKKMGREAYVSLRYIKKMSNKVVRIWNKATKEIISVIEKEMIRIDVAFELSQSIIIQSLDISLKSLMIIQPIQEDNYTFVDLKEDNEYVSSLRVYFQGVKEFIDINKILPNTGISEIEKIVSRIERPK